MEVVRAIRPGEAGRVRFKRRWRDRPVAVRYRRDPGATKPTSPSNSSNDMKIGDGLLPGAKGLADIRDYQERKEKGRWLITPINVGAYMIDCPSAFDCRKLPRAGKSVGGLNFAI